MYEVNTPLAPAHTAEPEVNAVTQAPGVIKLTFVSKLPENVADPLVLIEPVNVCVLELNEPKLVDPVTELIDDVIVCTTNVVAVIVPVVLILPDTDNEPVMDGWYKFIVTYKYYG